MNTWIRAIEFYLPEKVISTQDLSDRFPRWRVEKIAAKTGIADRHIASEDECASDLAVRAAQKLFDAGAYSAAQIDFVLLCTQSPDYALPTTACLIQHRLGIPTTAGALDFNLGCSGFIYGLGLAQGLIATHQAGIVLLITAETYSKYISSSDKASLCIFGDGAAATIIAPPACGASGIGSFVYGTDGSGGRHLMVPGSGARRAETSASLNCLTSGERPRPARPVPECHLHMNGSSVFEFALTEVPKAVHALLIKADLVREDIDLFVFHQANAFLLEELRVILQIEPRCFQVAIDFCANTVSSSIPIALKIAETEGRLWEGAVVMLVGFGVGFSWGATIIRWAGINSLSEILPQPLPA